MKFSTRFNPPPSPSIDFPSDRKSSQSVTRQEFKNECEMNEILKRFRVTGLLTDPSKPSTRRPMWGDFSAIPDPIERANILVAAQDAWLGLPKALLDRFESPQDLINFVSDEKNRAEAEKLGLVQAKPINEKSAEADPPEPPKSKAAEPEPKAEA